MTFQSDKYIVESNYHIRLLHWLEPWTAPSPLRSRINVLDLSCPGQRRRSAHPQHAGTDPWFHHISGTTYPCRSGVDPWMTRPYRAGVDLRDGVPSPCKGKDARVPQRAGADLWDTGCRARLNRLRSSSADCSQKLSNMPSSDRITSSVSTSVRPCRFASARSGATPSAILLSLA
jgi:hypothetical protein